MTDNEIHEALDEIWEYFDQREDAELVYTEYPHGGYVGNKEMQLKQLVEQITHEFTTRNVRGVRSAN